MVRDAVIIDGRRSLNGSAQDAERAELRLASSERRERLRRGRGRRRDNVEDLHLALVGSTVEIQRADEKFIGDIVEVEACTKVVLVRKLGECLTSQCSVCVVDVDRALRCGCVGRDIAWRGATEVQLRRRTGDDHAALRDRDGTPEASPRATLERRRERNIRLVHVRCDCEARRKVSEVPRANLPDLVAVCVASDGLMLWCRDDRGRAACGDDLAVHVGHVDLCCGKQQRTRDGIRAEFGDRN